MSCSSTSDDDSEVDGGSWKRPRSWRSSQSNYYKEDDNSGYEEYMELIERAKQEGEHQWFEDMKKFKMKDATFIEVEWMQLLKEESLQR